MPISRPTGFAYVNGEIDADRSKPAWASSSTAASFAGDGVYEITPCFNGKLMRLDQHLERLRSSLRFAGITLEISQDDLVTSTAELVHLNREVTASRSGLPRRTLGDAWD